MYIYGMNDEETGIDSADRAASQHTDHRDDDGGLVGILTFKKPWEIPVKMAENIGVSSCKHLRFDRELQIMGVMGSMV